MSPYFQLSAELSGSEGSLTAEVVLGGVTPTEVADFVIELIRAAKRRGLSIGPVKTTAYAPTARQVPSPCYQETNGAPVFQCLEPGGPGY